MKLIIAAAVVAFAMPAIAQDTPAAPPPNPMPQTAPMPAPTPPAPPATDMAVPAPMPADPAAPAPMAAPTSATPTVDTGPAPTTDGSYPMCSKTVTDHCTERSNVRGERLHSTPRKPG